MSIIIVILILIFLFALSGNKKTGTNKKIKLGYPGSTSYHARQNNPDRYDHMSRPDGSYGSNGSGGRYGRPYWKK